MYAPDGDGVMMTHYRSMQYNQPRMRARGRRGERAGSAFTFVDATNLASPDAPHMDHVTPSMPETRLLPGLDVCKTGAQAQKRHLHVLPGQVAPTCASLPLSSWRGGSLPGRPLCSGPRPPG